MDSFPVDSLLCLHDAGCDRLSWFGHAGREALSRDGKAVRYGSLALGLLAAIAFLPRQLRRLRGGKQKWIDVGALTDRLRGGGITIVDVRGPDEFDGPLGHIDSALNLSLGELPDRLIEISASRDLPVILVCRTGKRLASAATLLSDGGFRDIGVLRGGMEQWNRDGLPVDR